MRKKIEVDEADELKGGSSESRGGLRIDIRSKDIRK